MEEAAVDAARRHREPGLHPRQEDPDHPPGARADLAAGGEVGREGEVGRRQPAGGGERDERRAPPREGAETLPGRRVEERVQADEDAHAEEQEPAEIDARQELQVEQREEVGEGAARRRGEEAMGGEESERRPELDQELHVVDLGDPPHAEGEDEAAEPGEARPGAEPAEHERHGCEAEGERGHHQELKGHRRRAGEPQGAVERGDPQQVLGVGEHLPRRVEEGRRPEPADVAGLSREPHVVLEEVVAEDRVAGIALHASEAARERRVEGRDEPGEGERQVEAELRRRAPPGPPGGHAASGGGIRGRRRAGRRLAAGLPAPSLAGSRHRSWKLARPAG